MGDRGRASRSYDRDLPNLENLGLGDYGASGGSRGAGERASNGPPAVHSRGSPAAPPPRPSPSNRQDPSQHATLVQNNARLKQRGIELKTENSRLRTDNDRLKSQNENLATRLRQQERSHALEITRLRNEAGFHKRLRSAAEVESAELREKHLVYERRVTGIDEAQDTLIHETQVLLAQKNEALSKIKQYESELAMHRETVKALHAELDQAHETNQQLRDEYDRHDDDALFGSHTPTEAQYEDTEDLLHGLGNAYTLESSTPPPQDIFVDMQTDTAPHTETAPTDAPGTPPETDH